jgi:Protein of unknown function (DUF4231)
MTEEQPAESAARQVPEEPKQRRKHWPALLKRFPRFFWRPKEDKRWDDDWPVVPTAPLDDYRALESDLILWRGQLESRFRKLDHRAKILQNQFWRQRVLLITGGLVATSLATAQAAIGGGNVILAVLQAGLTGLLAGLTVLIRSRRAQQGYLSARLKAERIKSEYFLFLAMAGDYKGADRVRRLRQQVEDIEAAEDVS